VWRSETSVLCLVRGRYVAVQSRLLRCSSQPAGDAGSSSVQPTDREGDGP
jgi:hypothetical protein